MRQQSKRQMVQPEAGSSRLASDEVYNASSVMMPNPRVLWVPMFERRSFTTRGTGPSSPYDVLIDPVLMGVGPQLAGITVHALVEKATTNFLWAIKALHSVKRVVPSTRWPGENPALSRRRSHARGMLPPRS